MLDSSFIEKKLDHYLSFTSRNENFLDQKVYLFYLKSLQSKNVILLYDFINFMNFGDGQFWFYEIIVCNILVEPPLPLASTLHVCYIKTSVKKGWFSLLMS